ncbi:MAG TPA: glycoside hydrolase family 104 protein [Paralcaligenes sp.]|jgi:Muramidase (phage lambda lysozyme)
MPRISVDAAGGLNVCAFLDMLAWSEGTSTMKGSDDGYNVIVGHTLFPATPAGYADHPRILVPLQKLGIKSSAAGRYQVLARYFDHYKKELRLPGFDPVSQDCIALRQIKEERAFGAVLEGDFERAVYLVKNIWASLPGAGYGQHEHKLDALLGVFCLHGGEPA